MARRRYYGRGPHADYPEIKERLNQAFKAVRKHGILARQNFSCCSGCAGYELADKMDDLRRADKAVRGAVFYHRQATEQLVSRGEVYLGFGCDANAASNEPEGVRTRVVGCFMIEALDDAGLAVEWNGSPHKCILVKGLKQEDAS